MLYSLRFLHQYLLVEGEVDARLIVPSHRHVEAGLRRQTALGPVLPDDGVVTPLYIATSFARAAGHGDNSLPPSLEAPSPWLVRGVLTDGIEDYVNAAYRGACAGRFCVEVLKQPVGAVCGRAAFRGFGDW